VLKRLEVKVKLEVKLKEKVNVIRVKLNQRKNIQVLYMAHLFEIDDDMSPLQCHSEECVMNVFN
jgi:hypothetical protein